MPSSFFCRVHIAERVQQIHETVTVILKESVQITESAKFDQHQEIACKQKMQKYIAPFFNWR